MCFLIFKFRKWWLLSNSSIEKAERTGGILPLGQIAPKISRMVIKSAIGFQKLRSLSLCRSRPSMSVTANEMRSYRILKLLISNLLYLLHLLWLVGSFCGRMPADELRLVCMHGKPDCSLRMRMNHSSRCHWSDLILQLNMVAGLFNAKRHSGCRLF